MFEPTIKDIAKICGVGVSTVSRAINNHPDINPETKEKIMNTIKEYGYVPNNSARNLKRVDAKAIAVLVKGIANPFFANMIKIIEEECKRKRYSMELQHIESDEDEVDVIYEIISKAKAPVKKDEQVGKVRIYINGKLEEELPILTKGNVKEKTFRYFLHKIFLYYFM